MTRMWVTFCAWIFVGVVMPPQVSAGDTPAQTETLCVFEGERLRLQATSGNDWVQKLVLSGIPNPITVRFAPGEKKDWVEVEVTSKNPSPFPVQTKETYNLEVHIYSAEVASPPPGFPGSTDTTWVENRQSTSWASLIVVNPGSMNNYGIEMTTRSDRGGNNRNHPNDIRWSDLVVVIQKKHDEDDPCRQANPGKL